MKGYLPILVALILPLVALYELTNTVDWQLILSYSIVVSAVSIGLNWLDKRRAQNAAWRISEKGLHTCELLGGWPASYLAQQLLRHKTSKNSYRIIFWCIVGLHQFLAFEWITGWRISRSMISLF